MVTQEHIVSLHRYWIWANRMRTDLDNLLKTELVGETPDSEKIEQVFIVEPYMSYWYGGLYVVIEGWRKLGLQDDTIDDLLTSPNVDLLRRYRNVSFHYQADYYDKRMLEFMEAEKIASWVRQLNREFGRYFLERIRLT